MCVDLGGPAKGFRYAVVVVRSGLARRVTKAETESPEDSGYLARTFHYAIPDSLADRVRLGQLVWVPFGSRHVHGVVIGFDRESPVEDTRPLARVLDPEPVLSAQQIRLARWISAYYLAPLYRVVWSMLPPGVTRPPHTTYVAGTSQVTGKLSVEEQELLALLGDKKPRTAASIARAMGWETENVRQILDRLVRRGYVTRSQEPRAPRVRLRQEAWVCLSPLAVPDQITLGERAFRQRQVFSYLLECHQRGMTWLPLAQVIQETGASRSVIQALVDKGLLTVKWRTLWRTPLQGYSFVPLVPPTLTPDQEAAWQLIRRDLDAPGGRPFLLQGVTGSGKTEVYLRAVGHVLERGQSAIVLVPEIALTPQTIQRFGARFGNTIAVLHSRLSPGERYEQWQRVRAGELRLVIGSRSAILAPVRRLGLIVLDEEHEWTYKQETTPRYHARDVAIQLAKLSGATLILGSATPDLESAYRAERGEFVRLRLPQRIMGHRQVVQHQLKRLERDRQAYRSLDAKYPDALFSELPPVEIVDMRQELRSGNTSILSRALHKAIAQILADHEQAILFLNRRGTSSSVLCRDCGYIARCPRCNLPLTYHAGAADLVCHHCNYRRRSFSVCPECGSKRIRHIGIGTERVEEIVKEMFPQARTVRWDLDTTGRRHAHERLLKHFVEGKADILIGTQMVAKGLDLPRVTLVGVILADTTLSLPDFRASERTFQLLAQVAGRAGRSVLGGQVIIQTYLPDHPVIKAARRHDYDGFYRREIEFRRMHWYPPFSRLVRLVSNQPSAQRAKQEAYQIHEMLSDRIRRLALEDLDLIGPAPAFYQRLRGKWRWQILVRGKEPQRLVGDIHLPLGWQIDVDPVSVL